MNTGRIFILLLLLASLAVSGCRDRGQSFKLPEPSAGVAPEVEKNSFAGLVERVQPAVVTVRSARVTRAPQQHPFMDDPFFRDFFGQRGMPQQQPRGQVQQGLGSGVVISADGYIVTNHHVIDGAEQIVAEFSDRRTFEAKLVGSDPPSDLAVLKIEANDLPVLTLGNSDNVRVGDVVLAVGNPLGVGQTVTQGIISAKGRQTGLSDGSFEDFLQTDAAINRGNSGGALVNTSGELVGINSQILSPSGGNIGIGFAIPANMVRAVTEQLISDGTVRRGQLGVSIQAVTADIAASLGLENARGVIVNSVVPGSAADRAGLRRGDIVVAAGGRETNEPNALRNLVASTRPGSEIALTVLRDGREQEVKVTLGEFRNEPAGGGRAPGGGDQPGSEGGRLGITVTPVTPEVARQFGFEEGTEGLVVTEVEPGGPAGSAGLQPGDVIQQANRADVRSIEDLRAAIGQAGGRPLLLLVNRPRAGTVYVTVRPRS
ncbi:MAG TPA: DegQ family serine endoprotease [Pyrinomonadaceae bacterium]|nr:DegQ family serine endoprotease [Pyrinomonadaceae bacterium]